MSRRQQNIMSIFLVILCLVNVGKSASRVQQPGPAQLNQPRRAPMPGPPRPVEPKESDKLLLLCFWGDNTNEYLTQDGCDQLELRFTELGRGSVQIYPMSDYVTEMNKNHRNDPDGPFEKFIIFLNGHGSAGGMENRLHEMFKPNSALDPMTTFGIGGSTSAFLDFQTIFDGMHSFQQQNDKPVMLATDACYGNLLTMVDLPQGHREFPILAGFGHRMGDTYAASLKWRFQQPARFLNREKYDAKYKYRQFLIYDPIADLVGGHYGFMAAGAPIKSDIDAIGKKVDRVDFMKNRISKMLGGTKETILINTGGEVAYSEKKVTFRVGLTDVGMEVSQTGAVKSVARNGAADRRNVEDTMVAIKVNGQPFSKELYNDAVSQLATKQMKMTFRYDYEGFDWIWSSRKTKQSLKSWGLAPKYFFIPSFYYYGASGTSRECERSTHGGYISVDIEDELNRVNMDPALLAKTLDNTKAYFVWSKHYPKSQIRRKRKLLEMKIDRIEIINNNAEARIYYKDRQCNKRQLPSEFDLWILFRWDINEFVGMTQAEIDANFSPEKIREQALDRQTTAHLTTAEDFESSKKCRGSITVFKDLVTKKPESCRTMCRITRVIGCCQFVTDAPPATKGKCSFYKEGRLSTSAAPAESSATLYTLAPVNDPGEDPPSDEDAQNVQPVDNSANVQPVDNSANVLQVQQPPSNAGNGGSPASLQVNVYRDIYGAKKLQTPWLVATVKQCAGQNRRTIELQAPGERKKSYVITASQCEDVERRAARMLYLGKETRLKCTVEAGPPAIKIVFGSGSTDRMHEFMAQCPTIDRSSSEVSVQSEMHVKSLDPPELKVFQSATHQDWTTGLSLFFISSLVIATWTICSRVQKPSPDDYFVFDEEM